LKKSGSPKTKKRKRSMLEERVKRQEPLQNKKVFGGGKIKGGGGKEIPTRAFNRKTIKQGKK